MEKRRLGNSVYDLTVIGFGAWAIGGAWKFGWGSQDDRDSIAAIHEALEHGVNWIDTAAVYGLGHSEAVVAEALSEWRGQQPLVFTKCTRRWRENRDPYSSLKADSIREEAENSLRRLKVDVIDLFQIHWPDPDVDIEEAWTEMARLQQAGKVRYIGVSNFNVSQMKRAQAIAPITSLQPPYSLVERGVEAEILPYCRAQGIGVIGYSPMESGLLTGTMTRERIASLPGDDWRRNNRDFKEPNLTRNLVLVEALKQIAARHGSSPGEVAIAWTLRNPAVTGSIVGLRKPGQAAGVLGAAELRLNDADIQQLESFFAANPLPGSA
jgi:aryl-alcohol dehydrogenase-like predicted oxidoreductase